MQKQRKNKRWSDEEIQRLVKLYPTTPVADLAEMFDCSVGHVYVIASEHGARKRKRKGKGGHNRWSPVKLKKFKRLYPKKKIGDLIKIFGGTRAGINTRASNMGLRKKGIHHWTPTEIEMLRELYPDTNNVELGKIFKVNDSKIQNLAIRIGLRKSAEFMANPANRSCFPKGHVPQNKGKKQSSYMNVAQIARTKATRFKKGHLPKNTLTDGVITIRHNHKERGARPYKWIRVGLAKWKMYHVHLWEQANGPVPAGHIIIFRDKDTMNCSLDNLMMITRAEHARRNHNKEKAAATLRSLSDRYVAGKITPRNKRLRKKLLKEPALLEVARQNMLLNRQIRKSKKS